MAAEVENRIDVDGAEDEEAAFSSVPRSMGGGRGKGGGRDGGGESSHAIALTKERLAHHDNLRSGTASETLAREHALLSKRVVEPSMISEMKRINALNLEPALPKLDDKTRNDWINFKSLQSRGATRPAQENLLKAEFQQSLEELRKRDKAKAGASGGASGAGTGAASGSGAGANDGSRRGGGAIAAAGAGGSSFSFNPQAKEFSLNPGAVAFSPSSANSTPMAASSGPPASNAMAGGPPNARPAATNAVQPKFLPSKANPEYLRKKLPELLDSFLTKATREAPSQSTPDWPEAVGTTYREVLGRPNPANPTMPQHPEAMQGGGGNMPTMWQAPPGQMIAPANAPRGVGNVGMVNMPPGAVAVQPQMMQQQFGQMFVGNVGSMGSNNMGNQGNRQSGDGQTMPQPPQQQAMQPMQFNQQMMMGQRQEQGGGMGGQQPMQPNVGQMPNFNQQGVPMMFVAAGPGGTGYPMQMQQGGIHMQQQGGPPMQMQVQAGPPPQQQPGQSGVGQGGMPQQGQMMQQPMYQQQMQQQQQMGWGPGGGGPHQMGGHER
eukprot:gnl/TRDRNA2_/TRDRNA2_157748_c2_seq4.p1 gnl/TRDRNA2_/TRDRNA2_157748_c2~~gnl/TRDRNA2_/TRDRNA2_157748_c2_seq4.p1  ORF type:complete len:608 (+),score=153.18 gnl/TRDRNA2_/TRDRNA2_157748_c2_seq4:180-1826(+)